MLVAFGIIFSLFILIFIAIVVEETFLGGRRLRRAQKIARERAMEGEIANASTADHSPQRSE